jgi:hypothetical protein
MYLANPYYPTLPLYTYVIQVNSDIGNDWLHRYATLVACTQPRTAPP